jgi:DNA-binding LytR/AlgR family response regulator
MEIHRLPVLAGKSVLILEDSFLTAEDMRSAVEAVGGTVVGPVSTIDLALSALERHRPDVALLDVRIDNRTSSGVASRLSQLRVPFVVVTGLSQEAIPKLMRNAPYVPKPYARQQLIEALSEALDRELN